MIRQSRSTVYAVMLRFFLGASGVPMEKWCPLISWHRVIPLRLMLRLSREEIQLVEECHAIVCDTIICEFIAYWQGKRELFAILSEKE